MMMVGVSKLYMGQEVWIRLNSVWRKNYFHLLSWIPLLENVFFTIIIKAVFSTENIIIRRQKQLLTIHHLLMWGNFGLNAKIVCLVWKMYICNVIVKSPYSVWEEKSEINMRCAPNQNVLAYRLEVIPLYCHLKWDTMIVEVWLF